MADVKEIELQHTELVSIFNKLNQAVKNNESRQQIYKIIDDIIAYTHVHFSKEEEFMVQTGFPEIEQHRKMHQELLDEAKQLKGKFDYVDDEQFMDWLNHWPFNRVLAHIQYADKQFENHMSQSLGEPIIGNNVVPINSSKIK
jgi:hemerythrin-like metal-binding protein